ncbi:MAG TPA: FAD-containing oxidoreductase [Acidobacteriaceae bacterium]|jgi:pyruvate/2-oxoglutarate dehydrogenase complex dihydrolipoamide dehydrogenase (E3) component
MSEKFDDVVVGSGQAGPFLAVRLANAGRKVAVVERKLFGGTCVNTGCTPTKTMIASAEVAHKARDAARYGVHIAGDVRVSLAEVKERADKIVAESRNGIENMLNSTPNCTVFRGTARFVSPHALTVNGQEIEAERIFLNVGGRAAVPDMPGVKDVPFLNNSSLLQLTELPEHLVVVGGGYIGMEFAQMFRRFGSKVTVVEMGPRLCSHEDPDVSDALAELFRQEDTHLRLYAKCIAFSHSDKDVCVHVDCTEGPPEIVGSHILLAVGRVPNTDDLGLEAAGVKTDDRGFIPVDDKLVTNVPHIFAIGDVNRRGAFTHTSYNDFEIVAANLLDGEERKVTDRIQCHALYTDPPLAQVGMTETEVRKSGRKALMATRAMTRVGRANEKGENFGFMKALVDAETKQILGASILGVTGDEAIHCILDIMYAKAPYTLLTHAVHIHPTVSELIPTLFEDLKPLQ